jgi:hypothetical protein
MKLLAVGLALIALAGGVNYFNNDDQIHAALSGLAREADAVQVANAVEEVDTKVDEVKADFVDRLPPPIRDNLAWVMLVGGLASFGAGLRMKLKAAGDQKGHVVRDVGRMIAAPGFAGIVAFAALSWHRAIVVRSALGSFGRKLFHGELSRADVWDLTTRYTPWAWTEVSGVLLLGLGAILLGIGAWIGRRKVSERFLMPLDAVRRFLVFGGLLCVGYFLVCALVAIASYGGALRVVVWPWKIDPGAFLVTLALMAFGLALSRTGTVEQRRQDALKPAAAG